VQRIQNCFLWDTMFYNFQTWKCIMIKRFTFYLNSWYCLLYSKPTHALLLNTLSHPHFKTLKLLKKCFVKTLLKPYMFRSLLYDHPQESSFVLSALPLLRLFASSSCLFGMWLYVVYVCVCVSDVPVCGMSGHEYLTDRYIGHARTHAHAHTHTHRQHTATYQISNWTKQTSEVVMH
jgi:hypothetical protein